MEAWPPRGGWWVVGAKPNTPNNRSPGSAGYFYVVCCFIHSGHTLRVKVYPAAFLPRHRASGLGQEQHRASGLGQEPRCSSEYNDIQRPPPFRTSLIFSLQNPFSLRLYLSHPLSARPLAALSGGGCQSSGSSTAGWLGLLSMSHWPSHRTASSPAGFSLHNSAS